MIRKIIFLCLLLAFGLSILIYFRYRGFGWPLGTQGIEALGASSILLVTSIGYLFLEKKQNWSLLSDKSARFGLIIGLLWTLEIAMNNILIPPLPARDIYDDLFWAVIALLIFILSLYNTYKKKSVMCGIQAGLGSGFASGLVACLTALTFIVFGMQYILNDPLNMIEWSQRGGVSNVPTMATYFAYQTLAGAMLHLIVLGILMGLLLGILGGLAGNALYIIKKLS